MTDFDPPIHPDDLEFMGRFHGFHPLAVAGGFLLLFLPAWWILHGAALRVAPEDVGALVSAQEVRCLLDVLSSGSRTGDVVVLGDSVLREGALRAHGDADPAGHALVPALRRSAVAGRRFWDLGFDGLLPMDALAVVDALNRRDPENAADILLELTPRYLSPEYQMPGKLHSRPLFRDLASRKGAARLALSEHRLGLAPLRLTFPRWLRHPHFPRRRGAATPLELLARVRPHFSTPSHEGPQVRALATLARRTQGRLTAFETPINALFLDAEAGPDTVEEAFRIVRSALGGAAKPPRVLRPDGGRFSAEAFLDHCHLTHWGNAALARRIARASGWASPRPARPLVAWRPGSRASRGRGWRIDPRSGDLIHEDEQGRVRRPDHLRGLIRGSDAPTLVRWSAKRVYVLHGRTIKVRSFLDAGWRRTIPLPSDEKIADLQFDSRGRAVLVHEATGALLRLTESALLQGDRSAVEVLTRPSDLADLADSARLTFGLAFAPLRGHPTPMPPVSRVFTADDGETLLAWSRHPLWRGTVFRLNPTPGIAYPLWPPDDEGHRFGPNPLIESRPRFWEPDTRALVFENGMELLEERLRRFSWTYGTPPDPAGRSVTANGYTLGPPSDRNLRLRIGVFGSSVAGATRPLGAEAFHPPEDGRPLLFSTLSLAVSLERSLNATAPLPVVAMDLTVPRGTLLDQLAGFSLRPPGDLDAAVFTLGPFAFRTEAESGSIPFSEAWGRLERDENGRVVADRRRGFLPFARIGSRNSDAAPLPTVLEELAAELSRRCRERGLRGWLVDMGRLTPLGGDDDRARRLLRAAALRHGLGVVVLAPPPDRPDLAATIATGDRHLAPLGLDWMGRVAAHHLASSLPREPSRLAALRRARRSVDESATRPRPRPQRIPIPRLRDLPSLDRRKLTISKRDSLWRVVVEKSGPLVPLDPSRIALLALGRGVGPLLHRGDSVEISVVRFLQRDEYGMGRRDAVEHLATFRVDARDLESALAHLPDAWNRRTLPEWLREEQR